MSEGDVTTPNAAIPTKRRSDRGTKSLAWWKRLADPTDGDAASLARLRRASTALEILEVRAAVILARQLGATGAETPDWQRRDILDLVRVLAHVKEHDPSRRPMQAAGWQTFAGDRRESDVSESERPKLSEARFRRLLEAGKGEEKVVAFTRLIALMDGVIKIDDLANDFLRWNRPDQGDRVRERWAFDYYHASKAIPNKSSTDIEDAG